MKITKSVKITFIKKLHNS